MSATVIDERILMIQNSMYQYSRAIYRSIKDLVDPYVDPQTQLTYRREVLAACEGTMERLAADPHYFAKPDKALFQDIRRYFPITVQAQVAWSVTHGVGAAVRQKHFGCDGPLVIDARIKPRHAPPLVEDPAVSRRVDELAAPGGPLHGLY